MTSLDRQGSKPESQPELSSEVVCDFVDREFSKYAEKGQIISTTEQGFPDRGPEAGYDSRSLMWPTPDGGTLLLTKGGFGEDVISKFAPEVGTFARKIESRIRANRRDPSPVVQEGEPFSYGAVTAETEPMSSRNAYELADRWLEADREKLEQRFQAVEKAKVEILTDNETVIQLRTIEEELEKEKNGAVRPEEIERLNEARAQVKHTLDLIVFDVEREAIEQFEQDYEEQRQTALEGQLGSAE